MVYKIPQDHFPGPVFPCPSLRPSSTQVPGFHQEDTLIPASQLSSQEEERNSQPMLAGLSQPELTLSRFKFNHCYLLAVCPFRGSLTSLCLSFLLSKGKADLPASENRQKFKQVICKVLSKMLSPQ